MTSIQPALPEDWGAWRELDRHVCRVGFVAAVRWSMAWWVLEEGQPVGVLRYQLFWEQIPFLNLLFLKASARRQGHGRAAMALWEAEMSRAGHGMVLVSTQSDEPAQHFYRKLGYRDCGCLLLDIPGYRQPAELFLCKELPRG